jgi:hypothetical protein
LGVYLGLKEKYIGASLAFGLLPLTRHEGIAVLGIWILYVLVLRNWKALGTAFLPLIVFTIIYFFVNNEFAFSIYFNARPTDRYGSGDWLHYIRPLPNKVGTLTVLFGLFSTISIVKSGKKVLALAPYIAYLAIHTIIYRYGLFASGGYHLFLLPLAPAFGLAAAMGFETVLSWLTRLVNSQAKIVAIPYTALLMFILIAPIVIFTGLKTKPISLDEEGEILQEAANWLQSHNVNREQVISTHVWFNYFYDIFPPTIIPPLDELSPGTVIVWDPHYSERSWTSYEQLVNSNDCWQKLESFGPEESVVLFLKSSDMRQCQ